jgi:hypothetical protein
MPNGYLNAPNPGDDGVPVVGNDTTDQGPYRFLIVGTAGTLKVDTIAGVTRTYPAVPVGRFDVGVRRVWATGTSAVVIGVP